MRKQSTASMVLGVAALVSLTAACDKLRAAMHHDAGGGVAAAAEADDAAVAASAAPVTSAAPSASAAKAGTPAPPGSPRTAPESSAGKKALAVPAPTVDRFPRNRLKDGPCPAGFVEQPGVEEHSSCARACKAESDCHGHTCVDSDVGSGKVCSTDPSKAKAPSRAANLPKCKGEERLWAVEEHAPAFCAGDNSCSTDKDCKGKGTCTDAFMLGDDGSLMLSHNGSPLGMKICKPK